jgi:probable HAF family extracellular repeat protein
LYLAGRLRNKETFVMLTHSKRRLSLLAISLALTACGALVFSRDAVAGKPDKPGKPGGDDETAPYLVTDLPGFDLGGSSQSYAYGVSNPDADGAVLVVGHSWAPDGEVHAVMWEIDAAGDVLDMTDLGILPGGTESGAEAVNDVGMAVGYSTIDDPVWTTHAVVFMPDGSVVDLGTLGGDFSHADAINNPDDNGVARVVGLAETPDGASHGAYWEVDILGNVLGPIDLAISGDFSPKGDINNLGLMAGTSEGIAALAFFNADGILQTIQLGTLGGSFSRADSVDDFGNAAGTSETAAGEFHAFLRQGGDGMTDLGTLGGPVSGASGVNVINGSVQVVGNSEIANLVGHAFLWENGTMTDLNGLIPGKPKWLLQQAHAVNEAGQITGVGVVGGRRGEEHGYLLTPDPQ